MSGDHESSITLRPILQRSGRYRSEDHETAPTQNLVVLQITIETPRSEGDRFEISVTGHDGHGQPFQTLAHCADIFLLDRIEDEDGLDVYRPYLPGGRVDVERTSLELGPLTASSEVSVDEIALVGGREMTRDSGRPENMTGVVNISLALFFETKESPTELVLSYQVTTTRGQPESQTPSSHTMAFRPEEWIPSTQQEDAFHGPFSWAARNSWLDVLRLWSSNPPAELGRTPFAWAAANGSGSVMEWYLEYYLSTRGWTGITKSSMVDVQDRYGNTPLHLAVKHRRVEIVRVLLIRGVDLQKRDNKGNTPLTVALENANYGYYIAKLLFCDPKSVASGSDLWQYLKIQDMQGASVIFHAAYHSREVSECLQKRVRSWINAFKLGTPEVKESETSFWKSSAKYLFSQAIIWDQGVVFMIILAAARILNVEEITLNTVWHEDELGLGDTRTPFGLAVENGSLQVFDEIHKDLALDPNYMTVNKKNTPLMLAIQGNTPPLDKRRIISAILNRTDVDISRRNIDNHTALDLAINQNLHVICRFLSRHGKDGALAEYTMEGVDYMFTTTTTTFIAESGGIRTQASQNKVRDNVLFPPDTPDLGQGTIAFKWFHLPANNMAWVEVRMGLLYGPAAAYKILKSERWVGRQHKSMATLSSKEEVPKELHHARFMRPFCQSFSVLAGADREEPREPQYSQDTSYVVFTPFLHWDLKCQQTKRTNIMSPTPSTLAHEDPRLGATLDPEQDLLSAYLFPTPARPHQVHVRCTLDQYYYYTLKHTEERDGDQVISRASCQTDLDPEHRVLIMVDRLWLWVLPGQGNQPDTVISCFPVRQPQPVDIPDPDRNNNITDVLGHIRLHLLDNPSSVQTSHDLAKLIISKCSAVFFDLGSSDECLRFPQIYEMAIGNVVREETRLFDNFTDVMQTPHHEAKLKRDVIDHLKRVAQHEHEPAEPPATSDPSAVARSKKLEETALKLCKEFYRTAVRQPVGKSDLERLWDAKGTQEEGINVFDALRWIGQIQVLDITAETRLLREIKDVRDELRIIGMVFEDQKAVVDAMEIIGAVRAAAEETSRNRRGQEQPKDEISHKRGSAMKQENDTGEGEPNGQDRTSPNAASFMNTQINVGGDGNTIFLGSSHQQNMASISESSSLSPGATVQLSIDAVQRMANRAHDAYTALTLLVDLKQKQSNVLDARSLRVQTEESLKMTKENERQGKTLMIFTLVTIIFLPMSFMAAFFAIPIAEFQRNGSPTSTTDSQPGDDVSGNGNNGGGGGGDPMMTLGYVSEIFFPVSAAITAFFIYAAFKVEVMEWTFASLWERSER